MTGLRSSMRRPQLRTCALGQKRKEQMSEMPKPYITWPEALAIATVAVAATGAVQGAIVGAAIVPVNARLTILDFRMDRVETNLQEVLGELKAIRADIKDASTK